MPANVNPSGKIGTVGFSALRSQLLLQFESRDLNSSIARSARPREKFHLQPIGAPRAAFDRQATIVRSRPNMRRENSFSRSSGISPNRFAFLFRRAQNLTDDFVRLTERNVRSDEVVRELR